MRTGRECAIYLSFPEMKILIHECGIPSFAAFEQLGKVQLSDRDVSKALVSLIDKKMLVPSDDSYVMTQMCRDIVKILKNARCVLICYGHMRSIPMTCIYVDGVDALTMQVDTHTSDMLRITVIKVRDLVNEMSEYDFMPVCTDPGKSEQDKERMNKDIRKVSLDDSEKLLDDDNMLLLIDRIKKDSDHRDMRLCVWKHPADDMIEVTNGKNSRCVEYDRDELFHMIDDMGNLREMEMNQP